MSLKSLMTLAILLKKLSQSTVYFYWVQLETSFLCCILADRQRSCGKIMFSLVSVYSQGEGRPHVTITQDALDLIV